ncbi:outer membrane lipid asymmetry maintenance protein MlaD [Marinobacterium mangrovicola]|uniref:Phospholipid/cholesterol/gamma-HCH transport system substrate-binding protein n=1 Tax=Marinobacterium mangrovicola TaxID=1476959 RepID=A0A4R1GK92_9GAMM|nr:outer membrane lipid asymmetry maintenance protein MlaD [Marinobacterium mangrovicola]TCK07315.1 phospholipid/cholesterol/gamma-HCH transport system substrate-binding protein [Marinobacterium mangrovicola]
MRMRTMEISVGFLMLAGFLALVVLALNVSGLNLSDQGGGYKVYARFDNIGGLTPRAKVAMSGVQIGEVTAIRLDPQMLMAEVEMKIRDDVDFLSTDSSAQILTSGLLGEQYIGITSGAEDEMLADGDRISDTQSALVLEDLIGKFLFNEVSD